MHKTAFFGVKGGQGTSLVATAFALQLAGDGIATLLRSHDVNETAAMLGLIQPQEDEEFVEVNGTLILTSLEGDKVKGQFHEVYDLGTNPTIPDNLGNEADYYLVLRPDYLALRKALNMQIGPTGIVLVNEPNRALTKADVEDVLGLRVRAVVPYKPAIATAVDAGLLARRMPDALRKGIAPIIEPVSI